MKAWKLAENGAQWVWPQELQGQVNQYVDAVHEFELAEPPQAVSLQISADTDYAVWLNGSFIGRGQFSDYPEAKTYDTYDVAQFLQAGINRLAVTAYYDGCDSSTYRKGPAGLLYAIHGPAEPVVSGSDTLIRKNPCYHSGEMARVSGQLSFTFGYDAQGEDGFLAAPLGPGWRQATDADIDCPDGRHQLLPRPVAKLVDAGPTATQLLAQGVFTRDLAHAASVNGSTGQGECLDGLSIAEGLPISVGWLMQHDHLSNRHAVDLFLEGGRVLGEDAGLKLNAATMEGQDGAYVILDMGREEAGIIELEVEAEAGCTLDIGYGEHLDDLRVRSYVGGRSFAARYVCRQGRQQFCHHVLRWSGRYLQLHVHGPIQGFVLHQLHLRRQEYPVVERGEFHCPDTYLEEIVRVGKRTLHLCMHEHYEDTPWREQALYANDSRTQALCGYYAYGEADFPAASFALLGRGLKEDGFLELTAPARPNLTIPSFTLVWMLAVRDHLLYTGRDDLAGGFLDQMVRMLDRYLEERVDGLLPLRKGPGIWHFYDWTEGLDNYPNPAREHAPVVDSLLNCYLILAMEAARQVSGWLGSAHDLSRYETAIAEIRQQVHAQFYDADEGQYTSYAQAPVVSELPQALAILANIPPQAERGRVLEKLCNRQLGLSITGLSQSYYKYEALMQEAQTHGGRALDEIRHDWGAMLAQGATTFWETSTGASDFGDAGSLCHAWSAVPVYVYYQQLLGIRPLAPGFSEFAIDPITAALPCCEGVVPTPHGDIRLCWEREGEETIYHLSCPEGCRHKLLDPRGVLT